MTSGGGSSIGSLRETLDNPSAAPVRARSSWYAVPQVHASSSAWSVPQDALLSKGAGRDTHQRIHSAFAGLHTSWCKRQLPLATGCPELPWLCRGQRRSAPWTQPTLGADARPHNRQRTHQGPRMATGRPGWLESCGGIGSPRGRSGRHPGERLAEENGDGDQGLDERAQGRPEEGRRESDGRNPIASRSRRKLTSATLAARSPPVASTLSNASSSRRHTA